MSVWRMERSRERWEWNYPAVCIYKFRVRPLQCTVSADPDEMRMLR